MGKLKAIIFDVDGTLADTEMDGHLPACNEAFARMGFDIRWAWEEFKDLLKIPGNARRMRMALSTRTSLSGAEIDRIVPELFAIKKEIYLKRVGDLPLRPGVERIIREAIDRGVRLAIVSVSDEEQIRALLRLNFPVPSSTSTRSSGNSLAKRLLPYIRAVRRSLDSRPLESW